MTPRKPTATKGRKLFNRPDALLVEESALPLGAALPPIELGHGRRASGAADDDEMLEAGEDDDEGSFEVDEDPDTVEPAPHAPRIDASMMRAQTLRRPVEDQLVAPIDLVETMREGLQVVDLSEGVEPPEPEAGAEWEDEEEARRGSNGVIEPPGATVRLGSSAEAAPGGPLLAAHTLPPGARSSPAGVVAAELAAAVDEPTVRQTTLPTLVMESVAANRLTERMERPSAPSAPAAPATPVPPPEPRAWPTPAAAVPISPLTPPPPQPPRQTSVSVAPETVRGLDHVRPAEPPRPAPPPEVTRPARIPEPRGPVSLRELRAAESGQRAPVSPALYGVGGLLVGLVLAAAWFGWSYRSPQPPVATALPARLEVGAPLAPPSDASVPAASVPPPAAVAPAPTPTPARPPTGAPSPITTLSDNAPPTTTTARASSTAAPEDATPKGLIQIRSDVDCLIIVDGKQRGYTPALGPIELTAGTHTVRGVVPGKGNSRTIEVRVDAGVLRQVDLRFNQ